MVQSILYCVCPCVVPSTPRALSSFNVTKIDIGITWQRPDPPNGLIIEYTVSRMISCTLE